MYCPYYSYVLPLLRNLSRVLELLALGDFLFLLLLCSDTVSGIGKSENKEGRINHCIP